MNTENTTNTIDTMTAGQREKLLLEYVKRLTRGEDLESVRADFRKNFRNVDALSIANAEQHLILSGVPAEDVAKLCDVHSALFHGATEQERMAGGAQAPQGSGVQATSGLQDRKAAEEKCAELLKEPGHPLNIMDLENQALQKQIEVVRSSMIAGVNPDLLREEVNDLRAIGNHYSKKGDIFFPMLKQRYNITGPSDVMWTVDDEILAELRSLLRFPDKDDWNQRLEALLTRMEEMIYKETSILYPICVQFFQDFEWKEISRDMKGYELCLLDSTPEWAESDAPDYRTLYAVKESATTPDIFEEKEVVFGGGHMTVSQLEAMLNTIPMELTFIDDEDVNRYYNDDGKPKLFKRPLSSLDRLVYLCHPPKIEPMVRKIIEQFKAEEKDEVGIWMNKAGEDVYVNYRAVRDAAGNYVGALECITRMNFAREHYTK